MERNQEASQPLTKRTRRVILLAVAGLAVALPGSSASAISLPLPLPTPAPVLSVPSSPSGALGAVTGPAYAGGIPGAIAGPSGTTPTAPDGAAVLAALSDGSQAFLGPGAGATPGGGGSDNQGPNDNRGMSRQSAEATRQQYVMTAQVYALDFSQDALDAQFAGGGSGRFAWPEHVRTISQGFGCTNLRLAPNSSQCPSGHFHTGLDVAGPNLADVHAADTGIARVFSGKTGYGNYVIITHGNGYSTLYGHLHDIAVRDGQLVQRGDLIAHEGTTGNSTGPHLHFEVRQYGNYADPCPYLEGCRGY